MKKINRELLIATKNFGKIKEIEKFLTNLPFQLRDLNSFPYVTEPVETGLTFNENAQLKAKSYALQTRLLALADDSGLEVAALGGAPGIYSARYAGERATDAEKIEKLLKELNEADNKNRRARFICAMALAGETGEIEFVAEGICNGVIAQTASGKGGFGYDPVFIPDGFSATFGELSGKVKQQISHRAQAIFKIIQYLRHFYDTSG
jgi:XTP/dITP diphosphohydrolase